MNKLKKIIVKNDSFVAFAVFSSCGDHATTGRYANQLQLFIQLIARGEDYR